MSKTGNIKEMENSFVKQGAKGPPNGIVFFNTRNMGFFATSNEKSDINCMVSATGSVVAQISGARGGLGDGKTPTPAARDKTQSVLTQSGIKSVPSLTIVKNADGTGMTVDSGGGRKQTVHLATGDGKNGILITEGFVALYSMGTELIVHGYAKKVTSSYHLVQETNQGEDVPQIEFA